MSFGVHGVEIAPGILDGSTVQDEPSCPRVFVLSGIRILRESLVLALGRLSSIRLVGSSDLSATPGDIAAFSPEVLLLDMSGPDGLALAHAVREEAGCPKIVVLGAVESEPVVMGCATAGVSGFVAPEGSVDDILAAIHAAVRGELVCSPRIAGILLSRVSALAAQPAAADTDMLTQREREIVPLVSEGLSNKQIARALGIQNATVKNHIHSILGKLGVRRRGEVAAQFRHGRVPGLEAAGSPYPAAAPRGAWPAPRPSGPDPSVHAP